MGVEESSCQIIPDIAEGFWTLSVVCYAVKDLRRCGWMIEDLLSNSRAQKQLLLFAFCGGPFAPYPSLR